MTTTVWFLTGFLCCAVFIERNVPNISTRMAHPSVRRVPLPSQRVPASSPANRHPNCSRLSATPLPPRAPLQQQQRPVVKSPFETLFRLPTEVAQSPRTEKTEKVFVAGKQSWSGQQTDVSDLSGAYFQTKRLWNECQISMAGRPTCPYGRPRVLRTFIFIIFLLRRPIDAIFVCVSMLRPSRSVYIDIKERKDGFVCYIIIVSTTYFTVLYV